jgi:hypothetical protein
MKIGKRIVTFDIAARKRTCRNHLPGDEVAPHVSLSGCKAIAIGTNVGSRQIRG